LFRLSKYKILAKVGSLANTLILQEILRKPAMPRQPLILHYATAQATIFINIIIPISYETLHCRPQMIAKRNKGRSQPRSAIKYLRKSLN
jgi:hypothetical protein